MSRNRLRPTLRHIATEANLVSRRLFTLSPSPRILVLYLFADRSKYPDSHIHLKAMLKHIGTHTTLVRIDNFAHEKAPKQTNPTTYEITGDNSFWEFSGWKAALRFSATRFGQEAFDFVVFVNDAFLNQASQGRDLTYYKQRFNRFTVGEVGNNFLGDISYVRETHLIRGVNVSRWVKSSIYCMSYSNALQCKMTYVTTDELDNLIPIAYREGPILNETPMLNAQARAFMEDWLTRRWQWSFKPDPKNWPILRGKVAAILNERLLTHDLVSRGAKLIQGISSRGRIATVSEFSDSP